jgi:hypothetical protein
MARVHRKNSYQNTWELPECFTQENCLEHGTGVWFGFLFLFFFPSFLFSLQDYSRVTEMEDPRAESHLWGKKI